jgi:cytosine/adenosine deaminase-related metal-dependent hydrolase
LNAHHHLYSTLAPGIRPRGSTGTFAEILENLWWPLDAAIDREALYVSALLGIADSVRHGATMIFDHHASMAFVEGSLETVAQAFGEAGAAATLCFETSDRRGRREARRHIEENLAFHRGRKQPRLRALMGLHANLTLSEETLRAVAEAKPEDIAVHIHCGEAPADLEHCRELGYHGPVDRLHRHGLLDGRSILAHAVHLSQEDYRLIETVKPVVVCNAESNANNRVGAMDSRKIRRYVLGTDGMSGDMIAALRSHLLLSDRPESVDAASVFFAERLAAQNAFFPDTGTFRSGAFADIAVLDYAPVSPIDRGNLTDHLIFGARTGRTFLTVAGGRLVCRQGVVTFMDENAVRRDAGKTAAKLWRRYENGGLTRWRG